MEELKQKHDKRRTEQQKIKTKNSFLRLKNRRSEKQSHYEYQQGKNPENNPVIEEIGRHHRQERHQQQNEKKKSQTIP